MVHSKENKDCKCDCNCMAEIAKTRFISAIIIAVAVIISPLLFGAFSHCCRKKTPGTVVDENQNEQLKKFIIDNPEVLIQSLDAFQKKQEANRPKPIAPKEVVDEIVNDKSNTVLGNPKGKLVVIEFFDYNCGYCKRMNASMAEAVKKNKDIRWILVDTPIFGDQSSIISKYAYAANKQGKFKEFHEAVGAPGAKVNEEGLVAIGQKLGLDTKKLKKDANSEEISAKLAKNATYTKKMQMGGVPMFIINGQVQPGAFPIEKLEEIANQK